MFFAKWWRKYNWDPVPIECLPPTGLVATLNDEPIAGGFIYLSDHAKFGFMEYVTADPDISDTSPRP